MLRVQNRLKSGTKVVPVTVEEERAAGIQAGDVLLLFGDARDYATVVVLLTQYFNVGAEKALTQCSTAELLDCMTTINGFIVHATVGTEDAAVVWFDPNRTGIVVKNVPATCTHQINPEITETDSGKSVWQMNIADVRG